MIQSDKNKNSDWLKEHTLTKEQFKQLIEQKLERNKSQEVQARKQLAQKISVRYRKRGPGQRWVSPHLKHGANGRTEYMNVW